MYRTKEIIIFAIFETCLASEYHDVPNKMFTESLVILFLVSFIFAAATHRCDYGVIDEDTLDGCIDEVQTCKYIRNTEANASEFHKTSQYSMFL